MPRNETPKSVYSPLPSPSLIPDFDPVSQEIQEFIKKNPWYLKMPLRGDFYLVDYFDKTKKFRVLMKFDITSSLSYEEQTENIKTEALLKLKEIGIDLKQYQIDFTFD